MYFISLFLASLSVVAARQGPRDKHTGPHDLVCGGTSYHEETLKANSTIEIGTVPAGLYQFAVHMWSDENLDLQIVNVETNEVVVHWEEGVVSDATEVTVAYKGDVFTYSGHEGIHDRDNDVPSPGTENIIFQNFTQNSYKILAYAKEDGLAKIRYGWLPLDECDTWKHYFGHLDVDRHLRGGAQGRRELGNSLHNSIDDHTELTYTDCWSALQNTDQNPSNSGQVIGIYTRRGIWKSYRDGSSNCGGNRNDCWNREHVYPKSRGDFGTSKGAGTDIHSFRAEDRSVNTERSNKHMDDISGTVVPDCPICLETSSAFEPPDSSKGAVARMLFYMAIRYDGDSGSNGVNLILQNGYPSDPAGKTGYLGDLASLKNWNSWYPPSSEERNRNNIIQSWYQGNRNPFIDNPSLVNSYF